jgi:hypothetical protein
MRQILGTPNLIKQLIQHIHYSDDKASYKAVALTNPYAVVVP